MASISMWCARLRPGNGLDRKSQEGDFPFPTLYDIVAHSGGFDTIFDIFLLKLSGQNFATLVRLD